MSSPTAAEVLHHVNSLVGCLSTVCEDGSKLRDFPPDFSPTILRDLDSKLQLASSYVKTITNSYAPVNRIPVEVLNTILRLTIDHIPNFRPTLPRDPYYGTVQDLVWPYRNFTRATRVCRYWRTVSVQFASNWSTIQIFGRSGRHDQDADTALSSKFASLCLSRAASSPLDIALYTRPTDLWWEDNLLAQMHRFRLLAIDDVDILPNLCHPAPLLQSLTIEPTWRSGGLRPPATIPLLFSGSATLVAIPQHTLLCPVAC
ncbi:hypothetical protein NM688_g9280 [Phlebia brevispora]|uniref:Uncharacterized protein n=1 Tax=Phlebia brevispora TaxID=194682 RepID=A0ACC1RK17_9APHY|nr:hypothetical protein NM688_g9280 [Phlebia brevispora]